MINNEESEHGQLFLEHALTVLKSVGARITEPHLAILSYLANADRALSPEDILNQLQQDSAEGGTNLTRVSRILTGLSKLKLVQWNRLDGNFLAAEPVVSAPPMRVITYCTRCHQTNDVELESHVIDAMVSHVKRQATFTLTRQVLKIGGICPSCLQARQPS